MLEYLPQLGVQEPDRWRVVGTMELARYGSPQIAVGPNTLPCLRGDINFPLNDNKSTQSVLAVYLRPATSVSLRVYKSASTKKTSAAAGSALPPSMLPALPIL